MSRFKRNIAALDRAIAANPSRAPTWEDVESACAWIRTDPYGVANDIKRMGRAKAAAKNAAIAQDTVDKGDTRWRGVTAAALRQAFRECL